MLIKIYIIVALVGLVTFLLSYPFFITNNKKLQYLEELHNKNNHFIEKAKCCAGTRATPKKL